LNAAGTASRVVAGGWSYDGTNNTEDCNRHGTATASLAGGRTVGTSPNATLHAIRAVSCGGTAQTADLISALNYVALNAEMPAIVSMGVTRLQPTSASQQCADNNYSNSPAQRHTLCCNKCPNAGKDKERKPEPCAFEHLPRFLVQLPRFSRPVPILPVPPAQCVSVTFLTS